MFAIVFEVLLIEIQEEIHHFAGGEGGRLRGTKIVNKHFVNKPAFPSSGHGSWESRQCSRLYTREQFGRVHHLCFHPFSSSAVQSFLSSSPSFPLFSVPEAKDEVKAVGLGKS